MPALNFRPMFVDHIRSGRKNHTIRADRKVPIKVGDKLYLYCGMRQKGAFRILPDAVMCTKIEAIVIDGTLGIMVGEDGLSQDECEQLARCDGFSSHAEMMSFWDGRLPFKGQIIHWR